MQIPVGLPFSESMGDAPDAIELKTAIRKLIQLRNESQPEKLMNFAKDRDHVSYIHELKVALS
jgi:hypothetical protein